MPELTEANLRQHNVNNEITEDGGAKKQPMRRFFEESDQHQRFLVDGNSKHQGDKGEEGCLKDGTFLYSCAQGENQL